MLATAKEENPINAILEPVPNSYQEAPLFSGESAVELPDDNNGNLTQKTNNSTSAFTLYEYDAENKLIRVVREDGSIVNYKYDGLGRRIEKEVDSVVTRYIYDNEDILLELDGSNNITARYTHGPGIDEPLVMEKSGVSSFYHADGLGSITELSDSTSTVVQSYAYSSFGKIESQFDPAFIQPYTFTAREFDPETGLYFYRARAYDPLIGRFLQEDPIRFLASNNFYPYVANDPIRFRDPSGQLAIGAVVGAILGATGSVTGTIAQNGTWPEIIIAGVIGAAVGGAVGFADPTEGVLTTMALMGGIGGGANALGQIITSTYHKGNPLGDFSIGSFLGSTIGSAISAGMSQIMARGLALAGASEFLTKLGGLIGLAPSALGGPIGQAIEKGITGEPPQNGDFCPVR